MGVPTYMGMGAVTPVRLWSASKTCMKILGSPPKIMWEFWVHLQNLQKKSLVCHKIYLGPWSTPLKRKSWVCHCILISSYPYRVPVVAMLHLGIIADIRMCSPCTCFASLCLSMCAYASLVTIENEWMIYILSCFFVSLFFLAVLLQQLSYLVLLNKCWGVFYTPMWA